MPIDHVKLRIQALKWGTILFALGLPFLVYFMTDSVYDLKRTHVWDWVTGAGLISAFVLYLYGRYIENGFFRYYARGGTWEYLSSRFGIDLKPPGIEVEWSGYGFMDRNDVGFLVDAAATQKGLYLNFNALGRIYVPWRSIISMRKGGVETPTGLEHVVWVTLDGPELGFVAPWSEELPDLIPASIGLVT